MLGRQNNEKESKMAVAKRQGRKKKKKKELPYVKSINSPLLIEVSKFLPIYSWNSSEFSLAFAIISQS